MAKQALTTKTERREQKRRIKMKVSGSSVKRIQQIILSRSEKIRAKKSSKTPG